MGRGDPTTHDLILSQKHHDTNERRIVIQMGSVYTTFAKGRHTFAKYRGRNGQKHRGQELI